MFLIGFAVVQLQKEWSLGGFETGVILACSGLGTVLGAVLWGWAADRMGRRRTFFWCVLLFTIFTLASVFTPTGWWMMLALLRVLVGVGVGGLNIVSIPYVQEFVPTRQRGLLAGLGSVFIPLGLFLGSVSQRLLHDNWRGLLALGAASRSSCSPGPGSSPSRPASCSPTGTSARPASPSPGPWS